jgi:hypothetical protein
MTCLDYPNAVAGLPNEDSEFSVEGTIAHGISDDCLSLGFEPHDFIGLQTKFGPWQFEWTEDDADLLAVGIEEVRSMPGQFFGEQFVDLSKWLGPNEGGTLDRMIISPSLYVINDLKWGRGVPVSPVKLKQTMLYGLGGWENIGRHISDAKEFLFIIDQPRCPGGGGEWRCSLEELLAFGEEARAAAEATRLPNPPRVASDKGCHWCLRRKTPDGCHAYDAYNLNMLGMMFEDIDEADAICLPPPLDNQMTPERRAYLLRHKTMIEQWLETMQENTLIDALEGRPTPGQKAIEGRRPARKWFDPVGADTALQSVFGEKRFTQKLKSPTQVEKEIPPEKWSALLPLVKQGQPKPTLVPEGDARPAIRPLAEAFDDLP